MSYKITIGDATFNVDANPYDIEDFIEAARDIGLTATVAEPDDFPTLDAIWPQIVKNVSHRLRPIGLDCKSMSHFVQCWPEARPAMERFEKKSYKDPFVVAGVLQVFWNAGTDTFKEFIK